MNTNTNEIRWGYDGLVPSAIDEVASIAGNRLIAIIDSDTNAVIARLHVNYDGSTGDRVFFAAFRGYFEKFDNSYDAAIFLRKKLSYHYFQD